MASNNRVAKLARAHMAAHPGVRYAEARRAVIADQESSENGGGQGFSAALDEHMERSPEVGYVAARQSVLLQRAGVTAADYLRRRGRVAVDPVQGVDGGVGPVPVGVQRVKGVSTLRYLDLAEVFDGGDGPHGIVLGEAGAGKSALLLDRVIASVGATATWLQTLGIADIGTYDPREVWQAPPPGRLLSVPVGVQRAKGVSTLRYLDLAEVFDGGDGPHGIVLGEAGTGKSALLRVLALSLATLYSPSRVNLVLSGRSWGKAYERLPHAVAVLSDDSDDRGKRRSQLAEFLDAEVNRRESALGLGRARDFREHKAICEQKGSAALPELVVLIDEIEELSPYADAWLLDLLRVGRGLGIHVVMSGHRLHPRLNPAVMPSATFVFGFRTFFEEDSRAAIGTVAAAKLPRKPGIALFRNTVGRGRPERVELFDPTSDAAGLIERLATARAE